MVYYHAQHPCKRARNTSFTISGLAPYGSTPPFPYDSISRSDSCNFFRLFRLSNIPSSDGSYLTFLSPNLYRPTLVARYAPSEAPDPLFTSVLCGCCRSHRCRQIPTSGEEILALRSSATSQNRTCSYQPPPPTPPTSCSCQRSMVCGI